MIISIDEKGITISLTPKEREKIAQYLKEKIPALKLVSENLIANNIPVIFRIDLGELYDMRATKERSKSITKARRTT